jgi:uncharacterized small protein (DUF1192 family)
VSKGLQVYPLGITLASKWEAHTGGRDMSEEQDLEPRTLRPKPTNLDDLSINDLKEYIAELEIEIDRVQRDIADKESKMVEAQAAFKT